MMITDNVVVEFKCIHALNNRRSGKSGIVTLKLDMSKAYDKVEWEYIRQVLIKMVFSSKWVDLIFNCMESVSYFVLINGIS